MGILNKAVGGDVQKGAHAIEGAAVFAAVADQVDPTKQINWTSSNPSVVWEPSTSTKAQADEAEMQAAKYEDAVTEGVRVLKAETRKQQAHVKLLKAHRKYLGDTAQAHVEAVGANRGLAGRLQSHRATYAQMGASLERKEVTVNQQIDQIKHRVLG